VTVADGRLYLGTHDGRVLALDPARGEKAWEFASGDSVLAARVYAGTASQKDYLAGHAGLVVAMDRATGRAWYS
jgi:outer membrane protein assembly factor BamB